MHLDSSDPHDFTAPIGLAGGMGEVAVNAALRAGDIQMGHFRRGSVHCTRLLHDVKLETDRLCESAIVAAIRERYPDHAILSEECGKLPGSGGYTWIIDPLDGTVNFWHGLPFFCVSIACWHKPGEAPAQTQAAGGVNEQVISGEPVIGVVYLPFCRELFIGIPGRGAFLNGRPIRVSDADSAANLIATVNFGKTPRSMQRGESNLATVLPQVRKIRCLGAVAAELAYIAAGFLGGLAYEEIKLWDFAAGKILLEEAGGFLQAEQTGTEQWRVLAGAPALRRLLAS